MKITKKVLLVIFLFFAFWVTSSLAYEMNFGETPAQVSPGETFTVQISVSESTYLANGHITYDSNLFTFIGVDQSNMTATEYSSGNISWMYTEIANTPAGVKTFEFKFQAKNVTKTSSGDFTVTGVNKEGAKFITTDDYTYSGTEVEGGKTTTVTIYVPEALTVSPTEISLNVGDTEQINSNKNVTYESLNPSIATVDANGKVTGISPGITVIRVTDEDGNIVDVIVTITETTTSSSSVSGGDDTTANNVIPQTGLHENAKKILAVVVGVLFCIVVLIIWKKYKNWKKLFVIIPLVGVVAISGYVEAFVNVNTNKIKSGIFNSLDGVSNVVAVSPNSSLKYGASLTESDLSGDDELFAQNNLGITSITDKNGNTVESGSAIGTAYKINTYTLGDESDTATYNVVLYGDADGNTTFCDNDDIDVIVKDYVYNKKATGVYFTAANLYAYDDMLDVSDIQRMILKRFDNLDRLKGKDGTDGSNDDTLVNPFPEAESSLKVSPNKVNLDVNDTESIDTTGGTGDLTWTSRDPEVATVDKDGNITGVSKGNTIIDVVDEDGNSATIYVTVLNPAKGIEVDPTSWVTELDDKETKQLEYTLTPNANADATITWSSSDETVATVDENGLVTPVGTGTAIITVTGTVSAEDSTSGEEYTVTAECEVIIHQQAYEDSSYIDPADITLNLNEKYNEKTCDITIYLSPEYSDSTVKWTITDSNSGSCVKFTNDTDTTAKTVTVEGIDVTDEDVKVTVEVTNQNSSLPGFTKTAIVRVINSASNIDDVVGVDPNDVYDPDKDDSGNIIDGSEYPIIDGELILPNNATYYMQVEYDPEDSTSDVEWTSSNEDVATITSSDGITGKITTDDDTQGYTNITAKTTDKGVESDPIKVWVAEIALTGTDTVEAGLYIDDITATVYPSALRSNTIVWSSSDTSVATVDQNGKVHGVSEGTATITATLCASDGSKTAVSASMEITVNKDIVIKDEDGEEIENETEIIMSTASKLNWTTNVDSDVLNVEVENDGCLKSVTTTDGAIVIESSDEAGTATITISYKNGVTETINVTIIVGKMTIVAEEDTIYQNESTNIYLQRLLPQALAIKNKTIEWSIDEENSTVTDATITSLGTQTAKLTAGSETGTVVIIAEYGDTGITATCEVTIVKELQITSENPLLVAKGDTETIQTNYTNSDLKFVSSDTGIAKVDSDGVVTGVKAGTVTVTVTTPDGQTAEIDVIVGSIELSGDDSMEVGTTITLTPTITPDELENYTIKWTSSNTGIATVNNSGEVTGVSEGTVTITATLLNGTEETNIKATHTITVNTELELTTDSTIVLAVGETKDVTTTADDDLLSFKSNDSSIATIDDEGVVTGKKAGTTTITIEYESGATTTLTVTVIVGTIELEDATVTVGDTQEITTAISPSTLTAYGVTWTSSNTSVATVTSSGTVKGIATGTTTITATITGTNIKDTCTVTVVDSVTITATDVLVAKGETNHQIPYSYNGDSSDLTWTSASTGIATVNSNGQVTGVSDGTTVITVKNNITGDTATVNVTVGEITLSGDSAIEVGDVTTLTPTIKPTSLENNTIKWTSSDSSIATVASGIVTGVSEGTVTITATLLNGTEETNIKATHTITVSKETSEITAVTSTVYVAKGSTNKLKYSYSGNASDITWKISDTSICTNSDSGDGYYEVKGVTAGTTTVTATTSKNTITYTVIVVDLEATSSLTLLTGESSNLRDDGDVNIYPASISNVCTLTYSSSNTDVISVSQTGKYTAMGEGTATITVKLYINNEEYISKTIGVEVKPVIDIDDEIVMGINSTYTLIPSDSELDVSELTFESEDEDIVSVSSSGIVTSGSSADTTTVTVYYNGVEISTVTVKVIVATISIEDTATVLIGETVDLYATVLPTSYTGYGIDWTVEDETIATVNSTGNTGTLTGVKTGTVTVTATISGTDISDTCELTVNSSLSKSSSSSDDIIYVALGTYPTFTTKTLSCNYAGDTITWEVEDETIGYIVSSGRTPVGGYGVFRTQSTGTTKVTVTADTGEKLTWTIVVVDLETADSLDLVIGETGDLDTETIVYPSTLVNYSLTYTSNDTSIITIGQRNGSYNAIAEGTTTITVTLSVNNGALTLTAEVPVTVEESDTTIIGEIGDVLTNGSIDTISGHVITLTAESTSSATIFTWKSNDDSVVSVRQNTSGSTVYLTANSYGSTRITVSSSTDGEYYVDITVVDYEITASRSLYYPGLPAAGEFYTTPVTVNELQSAAVETMTYDWNSRDESIATVSQVGNNGSVKANDTGKVTIVAIGKLSGSYGGEIERSIELTINDDAVAQVIYTSDDVTNNVKYSTLNAAFSAADDIEGSTIQLLTDIDTNLRYTGTTSSTYITVSTGTFTLDLNGYTVTHAASSWSIYISKSAVTLTIIDSNTGSQGSFTSAGTVLRNYGGGTVNIQSGILSSTSSTSYVLYNNAGTLNITGGTISGVYSAIYNTGTLNINVGTDGVSTNVISTDTTYPTVVSTSSVTVGNSTDTTIYASSARTSTALYVGGGSYGISITDVTNNQKVYWYNGEIYGDTQAIIFDNSTTNYSYYKYYKIEFNPLSSLAGNTDAETMWCEGETINSSIKCSQITNFSNSEKINYIIAVYTDMFYKELDEGKIR